MINVLIRRSRVLQIELPVQRSQKKSRTAFAGNQAPTMLSLETAGDMKVLGIIGDPVKQVQSPAVFNDYFQNRGVKARMVPLHVGSNEFKKALEGLRSVKNFAGAIITVPHKHEAFTVAAERSPMVTDTEMANVLVPVGRNQWSADMLDGVGLFNALRKRNIPTAGLRTLIIGAGGAGTAIAVALQQLGQVISFGIADIDDRRAEKLVAKLRNAERADPDPAAYQLVINATPVGMGSAELPADTRRIVPGTVVCDAVMDPPKTRFLREAENNGCTIVEGMEMLLGQLIPIVRFFGLQAGLTAAGEMNCER